MTALAPLDAGEISLALFIVRVDEAPFHRPVRTVCTVSRRLFALAS